MPERDATFELVEKPDPPPSDAPSPWRDIGYAAAAGVASTAWLWATLLLAEPTLAEDDLMRSFLPMMFGLTLAAEVMGAVVLATVVWAVSSKSELAAKTLVVILNAGNAFHGLAYASSLSPFALVATILAVLGLWLVFRARRRDPA